MLIKLEGLRPNERMTNDDQLKYFISQLSLQTNCDDSPVSDWLKAFARLNEQIPDRGKTVVLLDEVSWMGYYDVAFPEVLKVAWDNMFSQHRKLVLVVCGSVSTWIKRNIIDNGAYAGRRSYDFVVPELPLSECVKFWGHRVSRDRATDILDVLSVTGGVPRYLEEVNPALSADENIRKMAFVAKSVLAVDFEEMFRDVITGEPGIRAAILRLLCQAPMNVSEIAAALGKERNGHLSDALDELSEAGFIAPDAGLNPETGKDVQQMRFRLKDNYARFYLKYIEPVKTTIDDGRYEFVSLETLENWDAVMGLQFENMVVNNYGALIPYLHLQNVLLTSAAPFRKSAVPSLRQSGCQIDLLIQSRRTSYIVEIKRKNEIGRDIIEEVDAKVRCLKTRPNVSVRTALVYDGHLAPIVEADGYFDAIVPFHKLLGLC